MGEFGIFGVHAGTDQDGAYHQMRVYAEVLQKIQSDYVTDPKREFDGLRHGFLELKVQVFLRGPELVIEPRPSSAKTPAPRKAAPARKRKTV